MTPQDRDRLTSLERALNPCFACNGTGNGVTFDETLGGDGCFMCDGTGVNQYPAVEHWTTDKYKVD